MAAFAHTILPSNVCTTVGPIGLSISFPISSFQPQLVLNTDHLNSTTCWAWEVTCDSGRSEDQINCDNAGTSKEHTSTI